jgi:predicted 2-oxoglutarate/Fe(II)-dependent dioxygenase YbiX
MAINQALRAIPDHPAVISLTSCYHNLLRGWAEG